MTSFLIASILCMIIGLLMLIGAWVFDLRPAASAEHNDLIERHRTAIARCIGYINDESEELTDEFKVELQALIHNHRVLMRA